MSFPHHIPTPHIRIPGRHAAEEATEKNTTQVTVPMIGTITLPPTEQLAFVGGIVLLAALDIIDWPVGVALTAGHFLATISNNKVVQDFGKALEVA